MKKLLIIGFLLSMFTLSAQESMTLKVMNYNLRFGELATLEELASYIRECNPDIVAIQELDCKTNRKKAPHQNGKDFIAELAYYTGMFGIFGKTIDYAGGYYGTGILSKYPFIRTERLLLPNPEHTEQRALLLAKIELANGQVLNFGSVHLALKEKERELQMKAINKRVEKSSDIVILAGDFNSTPEEEILKKEMNKWTDALPADFTFSTYEPKSKIDYIFYKPNQNIRCLQSEVDHSIKLSDHFPCFATFELF